MTEMIDIDKLEPHPYSEQLFEQQTPSQRFIEDISEKLENPIIIDDQNQIIDGIRRWKAAQELGWDEIEARKTQYSSPEQKKLAILRHDDNREANPAQKIRIGYEYEQQISPLLENRVNAGKSLKEMNLDLDLPAAEVPDDENVTAREIAAKRIDWSASKYYQGKRIYTTAKGFREVTDDVKQKATELMGALSEDRVTVHRAWKELNKQQKRQERTDPVSQEQVNNAEFKQLESQFGQVQDDLDSGSVWKNSFTTLVEHWEDKIGDATEDQKHILAYQIKANEIGDPYGRSNPKMDSEQLEDLYWGENGKEEHSLTELSIKSGVREAVVRYWMWQEGVDLKRGDIRTTN